MSWKAKKTVFNEDIVQDRDSEIAIGFPDGSIEKFRLTSVVDAQLACRELRRWIKAHLEDNDVYLGESP